MSIFDKIGNWWGTRSGYESARRDSGKRGYIPMATPRDQREDLQGGSRLELVKRSRYCNRNSGFHAESVSMMQLYSIGDGIVAQSLATGAAEEFEAYWREYCKNPEVSGRFDMLSLQNLVCRAIDVDGEIFALKTRDRAGNPKIALVETHGFSSVTDPERNLWDGIEFSNYYAPRYYHQKKPGKSATDEDTIRRAASSVIHCFEPNTPSASRGVPTIVGLNWLQDELELLSDETSAIKQNSKVGIVVTSDRPDALEDGDFGLGLSGGTSSGDGATTQQIADTLDARAVRLDSGESAQSFQSNRPNSMFQGHLDHLARDAGGGHLPFEVVRDASNIGGASVRLVTSKTDRRTRLRQNVMITRFLQHLWNYVMVNGIKKGDLPDVEGWSRVHWQTPRRITVDAGREEQQDRLSLTCGVTSFSKYLSERGTDFDDWLAMRSAECRKIMTAAGMPESDPIPLWMLYRPEGAGINIQEEDSTP